MISLLPTLISHNFTFVLKKINLGLAEIDFFLVVLQKEGWRRFSLLFKIGDEKDVQILFLILLNI